jgi:hypothetical protein
MKVKRNSYINYKKVKFLIILKIRMEIIIKTQILKNIFINRSFNGIQKKQWAK